MESLQEEIRGIRKQLRLAMNGVVSASMREKGVVYKLNFGVSYPEIREIARSHQPSIALAEALWKEDIREFKILATLLCPPASLSREGADRWVKEIPYQEIAEHACRNLFVELPYREEWACALLDKGEPFARTVAFLTWAECLKRGIVFSEEYAVLLWNAVEQNLLNDTMTYEVRRERAAVVLAMRFYGRQSEKLSAELLARLEDWMAAEGFVAELQEIYNELKFEFEYYR